MRISYYVFFILLILSQGQLFGQTPGMIIKPALAPGNAILDPDGDGYVSQKINGVQLGFTNPPNNDVTQSEIPYVAIVRPDPLSDILRGPVGGFIEIVGVDAAGNNAILCYNDGTNLMYRFRLGDFAPNSKSYSIMIDTDGKFGFTGPNADPNAVPGNPGFEVEIVLETNFNVNAYNVNGTTSGTLITSYSYDTNCQKSIAVTAARGNPDYFYDFYLPFSSLSSFLTTTTPIRSVAVTVMNPHPAVGNNALSDVGGVTTGSNLDVIIENLIDSQSPTLPGQEVLDRSACPTINAVGTSSAAITGMTTEAAGTTISVKVYQSDGVTLLGSGTTVTSGSSWSVSVSALSPAVTLATGQIVKATATTPGKGTSEDNCSTRTVTGCAGNTGTGVTITKISGGKGYSIATTFPVGTVITWYNSDYTKAVYPDKNGSLVNITNPVTTTAANQTVLFSTQTGQTFPNLQYFFTFQEPGKCVSSYLSDCQYSSGGSSVAPVVSSSPAITTSTTSISGTCGSSASTLVSIYVDGVYLKSVSVANSTSWTISGLNLTNNSCATITASSTESGKCPQAGLLGVPITHVAMKPTISTTGCFPTSPVTSVTGYSNDADGTIITVYKNSTSIGTATVASGAWTLTGLNLVSGDVIKAAATGGGCLTQGPYSDSVTISTQTNLTPYTISITAPTEGQSSVGGTISGGTYPVTLNVYIDQTQIGAGKIISSAGNWSVSGLLSTDLYINGVVNVTLTGASSCESALSSVSTSVECLQPAAPAYTGGSFHYCVGGAGQITLTTSEALVIYQLVDGSGNGAGPAYVGTGSSITLTTNTLNSNLGPIYVKAFKLANPTCFVTSGTAINFDTPDPTPTITFTSTNLTVQKGTASVNLPYSAKSVSPVADRYTISYSIAAKNVGFADVGTTTLTAASGNIALAVPSNAALDSYDGTLTLSSSSGGCTRSYGFTITVYSAGSAPVISAQPVNVSICSGSAVSMSVTAAGTITGYQWQISTTSYNGPFTNISGATSATYNSPALSSKTYYQVVVTNANGSTISDVASVFVTSTPIAGSITGTTPMCAGQSGTYSIATVSGATSYAWSYGGTGATITNGTTNAASVAFSSTATSGTLSVTANNSCGAGVASTFPITINATPFINAMNAVACSGASFSVTPADATNGIVPSGTTYSWSIPTVTGGITGGVAASGSSITGTLTNPTGTTQTAIYTVTPVKGSCTGNSFTVTVSVNPPITATATPIDATCNGASTGSIGLAVSGGTPAYTYSWTGGVTTQNRSSIAAGTYSVTVTDSKGCTKTTSNIVVSQPAAMVVTPTITPIGCNGASTGSISIAVSGGTGTKIYLWNDGSALQNRTSSLAVGTYSVTVTDANSCTQSATGLVVSQPSSGLTVPGTVTNVLCYNGASGAINITAAGGTGPYTYDWSDITGTSDSEDRTGLSAGTYSVTVTDVNGCSKTAGFTVTQPTLLSLSTTLVNATCPGGTQGAITLSVSGGTSGFRYAWTDGPTTQNRTGLVAGTYSVTVTDANNCTASTTATITNINPNPVQPGTITK